MKVPCSNLLILKPVRLHPPLSLFIIGFGLLLNLFFIAHLNAVPSVVISEVSQRTDASKKVDIHYNVVNSQPVTVSIYASQDNGITWNLPINLVSGDVGPNIYPGNGKHIVWDVLAEHPNIIYENVKFKVVADDGLISQDFVHVEGGVFLMGRTIGTGYPTELPVHQVTISSFYMNKYEVTQGQYLQIMGNNPSTFSGSMLLPVNKVTWYQAVIFCNKLSMQDGLTPCYTYINHGTDPDTWPSQLSDEEIICDWFCNGYRLPSEAEWEYAAKGGIYGHNYEYAGSNDIASVAWYGANSNNTTHIVGTKLPNELGIYDLSGNIEEWCWDYWGYFSSEPQINPYGPSSGTDRVTKSGNWTDPGLGERNANRDGNVPHDTRYKTFA